MYFLTFLSQNSDCLGSTAYGIADDVEAIQKEILTNGPVEVAFEVYDDFLHYDGGIYTVNLEGILL